ncbi:MAG: Hsp33 family molecular chaperone HslO [Clostridia bacterium]|nr:Hsp33 family molecular chaperone HslO [Clostridia bacterium]
MQNLIRTLVFDGQILLTLADTTNVTREAIRLHALSQSSALVLGKTLSAMTFMSACLKGETGEISLSVKGDGLGGEIGISGNRKLHLRGYIENTGASGTEKEVFGKNGSLTIIRDDGYSRPFVGACTLSSEGVDSAFEEYYRISEQLPTYIATAVEFDEKGALVFSGVAALQPLPFADEEVLDKTRNTPLQEVLQAVKNEGVEKTAETFFSPDKAVWELRTAKYQCNCSREYLTRVLVSLGNEQMKEIINEEGAVRVHCHYCNTDYAFTDEDRRKIFSEEV